MDRIIEFMVKEIVIFRYTLCPMLNAVLFFNLWEV